MYSIWWLLVKECEFGETEILSSPIDLRYRPYDTGQTTVWYGVSVFYMMLNATW